VIYGGQRVHYFQKRHPLLRVLRDPGPTVWSALVTEIGGWPNDRGEPVRCSNCGKWYSLPGGPILGGMGGSSRPGAFFFTALGLFGIGALAVWTGPWGATLGSWLRGLWIVLLVTTAVGALVGFVASATVAITDQYRQPGHWPTCPNCDEPNKPRPSSL